MKKTTLLLVGSAMLTSAGAWVGCGGSDATNTLTGDGDGGGDGSTANADSGTVATDSGGGTTDGGAGDAGKTTDGGTTNYDGGGPGGNTTSVPCGFVFCTIATEVCCVETRGNASTYACATGTACPIPDAGVGGNPPDVTALKCTGQANCVAGSICCVSQVQGMGGGGNVATSACVAGTSCDANSAQLCDPAGMPTGCAGDGGAGSACSSANIGDWGLKPPFATCGGKGN